MKIGGLRATLRTLRVLASLRYAPFGHITEDKRLRYRSVQSLLRKTSFMLETLDEMPKPALKK